MRENISVFVNCGMVVLVTSSIGLAGPVVSRKPLNKPDCAYAQRLSIQEAEKVRMHNSTDTAESPTVSDLRVAMNETEARVVFQWVNQHGDMQSYSYPILSDVDVVVSVAVKIDSRLSTIKYEYEVTKMSGSKRGLQIFAIGTDADVITSECPRKACESIELRSGEFGFDSRAWSWIMDGEIRNQSGLKKQSISLSSKALPGLIMCHAIGESSLYGKKVENQDVSVEELPLIVAAAFDAFRSSLKLANGPTLGPVRFPDDRVARLTKVEENLNEMIKINWIETGGAADQLKNAVQALAKSVALGNGQSITDQKSKVERLVTSLVERGQVLPEVRDFLLVHLAALRSEDTVKK